MVFPKKKQKELAFKKLKKDVKENDRRINVLTDGLNFETDSQICKNIADRLSEEKKKKEMLKKKRKDLERLC